MNKLGIIIFLMFSAMCNANINSSEVACTAEYITDNIWSIDFNIKNISVNDFSYINIYFEPDCVDIKSLALIPTEGYDATINPENIIITEGPYIDLLFDFPLPQGEHFNGLNVQVSLLSEEIKFQKYEVYTSDFSGPVSTGDVVFIPEPSTISLLFLGAAIARKRK